MRGTIVCGLGVMPLASAGRERTQTHGDIRAIVGEEHFGDPAIQEKLDRFSHRFTKLR